MKKIIVPATFLALALTACGGKMDDVIDSSTSRIRSFLHGQKIYDPDNLPTPEPSEIKGNYSVVGGAYLWVYNQDDDDRLLKEEVRIGDVVALSLDARIFTNNFDNAVTYLTNKPDRINAIINGNYEFDTSEWTTEPIIHTVGGGGLLAAVDNCLAGARSGDELRIFLPPDAAYGKKQVNNVPAYSTLAFQIHIDDIIKSDDERLAITEYLNDMGVYDRKYAPADAEEYFDRNGQGGYRYILNESRTDRPVAKEAAAAGDTIYYWYDARVFNTTFENSTSFESNIGNTDPTAVKVGDNSILINDEDSGSDILNSLGASLPDCRIGDKAWIFLPSDVAYGDRQDGPVPPGSTLVYEITVTEIKK